MRKFNTLGVFLLSLVWHGYEARFIFSVPSAALCVAANRSVRPYRHTVYFADSHLIFACIFVDKKNHSANISNQPSINAIL